MVLSLRRISTRASKAGNRPNIMHGLAMAFEGVTTLYESVAIWTRIYLLSIVKHRLNMLPNLKEENITTGNQGLEQRYIDHYSQCTKLILMNDVMLYKLERHMVIIFFMQNHYGNFLSQIL